jgi:hypothetical protein
VPGENMNIVKLKDFGLNLSGRPLGIQAYGIIIKKYQKPFELDFVEVFSIGSSFADEVVAKLADLNGGTIAIHNCVRVARKCLEEVAKDKGFQLNFV